MSIEHLEAIVLHTYNLTESSKIVVLLAPERGKVRAVAKGVRRTKSKFGSSLEPITHVAAQVHFKEGRDLQTLSQAETKDAFPSIRSDLKRLGLASVMSELMEQFVQENEEANSYFLLLLSSLKMLSNISRNYETLLIFFYLKMLEIAGLLPDFSHCARCKAPARDPSYLDAGTGGVLCSACSAGMGERISAGSLKIMGSLINIDLELLERIRIPAPSAEEMLHALNAYVFYHTGRKLRSAEFLREISTMPRQ
jgi:DNA repair protein RecO (recombination protein O)